MSDIIEELDSVLLGRTAPSWANRAKVEIETLRAELAEANNKIESMKIHGGELVGENMRLDRELAEASKLSEAISRDCNQVANERNGLRDELSQARQDAGRLLQALMDVENPLKKWQRDLKDGEQINGQMAIHMLKDTEIYREIARAAIAAAQVKS